MVTRLFHGWARALLPVITFLLVFQLAGCGDGEAEQRKAFIDFLQNTVIRSGEHLPSLSEDQKKKFGNYANDYAIIYGFSQQVNRSIEAGMKPVVDTFVAIRLPQDYLTQRDVLRQASGSLGVLTQQIQAAKTQADNSKATLKQPEDLKSLYDTVYNNVVTAPATALNAVLPTLQTLSQDAVQTGDFLQQQGTRVTYNGTQVQFPDPQQATQYNALMNKLSANAAILKQSQQIAGGEFR